MGKTTEGHAWEFYANGGGYCAQCGVGTPSGHSTVRFLAQCPGVNDMQAALSRKVNNFLCSSHGARFVFYVDAKSWQEFLGGPLVASSGIREVEVSLDEPELWIAFYVREYGSGNFYSTSAETAIWTEEGVAGSELLTPRYPTQIKEAINLTEIIAECQAEREKARTAVSQPPNPA
ncbi:MAG: hypothetical protein NTZ65_03725 [Candidatus Berkelbacteria bacterium]|nr:hypothetical protein [Candidatus Berkelbacteria bacterium]